MSNGREQTKRLKSPAHPKASSHSNPLLQATAAQETPTGKDAIAPQVQSGQFVLRVQWLRLLSTINPVIHLENITMTISPNSSNSIKPITGTKHNDILNGTGGDDIIDAGKGNDRIQAYKAYGNTGAQFDQLTGGAGADAFVMTDEYGNQGYLNDDSLATSGSRGFALVKDFEASLDHAKDTIVLDGFASHYRLMGVSWGQDFGKANTSKITDVAVVYIGAEQDKQDVVAVLQDVSTKMLTNPSGYLNNDSVFKFLG